MSQLSEATGRLNQLITLREKLANAIDCCESMRDLAALSRQYRETLKEIEEMEGTAKDNDEIGELLAERAADGKPGTVRKNRAGVFNE